MYIDVIERNNFATPPILKTESPCCLQALTWCCSLLRKEQKKTSTLLRKVLINIFYNFGDTLMKPELKCYTFSFVCGDDAFFFDIVADCYEYAQSLAREKFLRLVRAFIFEDPGIQLNYDPIFINDLITLSDNFCPNIL